MYAIRSYYDLGNSVIEQRDDRIKYFNVNLPDSMTVADFKMTYHNEKLEQFVAGVGKDRILEFV